MADGLQPLAVAALPTIGANPNEVIDGSIVVAIAREGYAYVEWTQRRMLTHAEANRIIATAGDHGHVEVTVVPDGQVWT